MLTPYKGRVYDSCCGSGGMFVQSEKFVEIHSGRIGDIAIFSKESNPTTRCLAMMNLAIREIEGNIGPEHANNFRCELHKDFRTDCVLSIQTSARNLPDWLSIEADEIIIVSDNILLLERRKKQNFLRRKKRVSRHPTPPILGCLRKLAEN
jgi:hypothetical protein